MLVDANFESQFEFKKKQTQNKALEKKWTPFSFTQSFSHSHFKKNNWLVQVMPTFWERKKKSKNKEHIGKK